MISKINTCVLEGVKGHLIEVETDISRGIPAFSIVGLPDISIRESKERVRSAIKNSNYEFPISRITVNLAPADIKKEGAHMDLAIAVGILKSSEIIKKEISKEMCFIGEVSLDGSVLPVRGALPLVIAMVKAGIKKVMIPSGNINECSVVKGIQVYGIESITQLIDHINGKLDLNPASFLNYNQDAFFYEDFEDVRGQESVKRAIEIAAAGGHNILMVGPPGAGKTMIARRVPSILPDMTFEEALEVTQVHSIAGLTKQEGLISSRPFRTPHHTSSKTALAGGGRNPKPGEISLAHNGVLFLDELPEFSKDSLEVLRQPMEDGEVTISRVSGTITYPAELMLVAAMNPCKCGYYGDKTRECSCSTNSIQNYLGKISGPLLDRIDLHIEIFPVEFEDIRSTKKAESSKDVKKRVNFARSIQQKRYKKENIKCNAQMKNRHIKKYCQIDETSEMILKSMFESQGMSARGYNKVLKVARTIADLNKEEKISSNHISEAINYRSLDKKYWS